jgi:ribosomal protein S18 acetylase RimI-like enzyme
MSERVLRFDADALERHMDGFAALLADAVQGGASVNFMLPFGANEASAYWRGIVPAVAAGRILLFAALAAGQVAGAVQLQFAWQPNQAHRADVAKLLVHSRARRRGLGRSLMAAAEKAALAHGRTLLTLDTQAGGGAEHLYLALGYTQVGVIRGYARFPDGPLGDAIIFYKTLSTA